MPVPSLHLTLYVSVVAKIQHNVSYIKERIKQNKDEN